MELNGWLAEPTCLKPAGWRLGADDYVVKPFNPAEVVARAQAVLRRTRASSPAVSQVLRVGAFQIDLDSHSASVQVAGQAQKLELKFKLLACLMRAPKRASAAPNCWRAACPRATPRSAPWTATSEALDIQGVPASVWGVGYRFGVEP